MRRPSLTVDSENDESADATEQNSRVAHNEVARVKRQTERPVRRIKRRHKPCFRHESEIGPRGSRDQIRLEDVVEEREDRIPVGSGVAYEPRRVDRCEDDEACEAEGDGLHERRPRAYA